MITQTQAEPELTLTPDQEESHTPRRPAVYSIPRRWRYVALGIIILIVAIWIVVRLVNGGANQARYVTAPVQYQDISATVEESGTVNPVNEVDVGTQVSGTISSLSVDFNSLVRKGQVLATLDSTPLQAASLQAHEAYDASQSTAAAAQSTAAQSAASVQSAIANARTAVATEDSANANVLKAAAAVQLAQTTVNRDTSLLAQGYIAQSQMDADVATLRADQADYQAAQAALSAAKAQASAAQTQIAVAADQHDANVSQAEAAGAQSAAGQGQVQQADYNLARAVITSPIDGIVVARDVSVGVWNDDAVRHRVEPARHAGRHVRERSRRRAAAHRRDGTHHRAGVSQRDLQRHGDASARQSDERVERRHIRRDRRGARRVRAAEAGHDG